MIRLLTRPASTDRGDLAEMVWTGGATTHSGNLDGKMRLSDLRRAWAPLNLESYVGRWRVQRLMCRYCSPREIELFCRLCLGDVQRLEGAGMLNVEG